MHLVAETFLNRMKDLSPAPATFTPEQVRADPPSLGGRRSPPAAANAPNQQGFVSLVEIGITVTVAYLPISAPLGWRPRDDTVQAEVDWPFLAKVECAAGRPVPRVTASRIYLIATSLSREKVTSLEIRAPEADALARELAAATGEDIDTAVVRAIEERLARAPRRRAAGDEAAIETEPAGGRRAPFSAKRGRRRGAADGVRKAGMDRSRFAVTVVQSDLGRSSGPHPIRRLLCNRIDG